LYGRSTAAPHLGKIHPFETVFFFPRPLEPRKVPANESNFNQPKSFTPTHKFCYGVSVAERAIVASFQRLL
jgi:hypothetical protein